MCHSINLPDNSFQNVMGNNAEKVSLYFSILASHFWTWCRVLHDKYLGVVIKTEYEKKKKNLTQQKFAVANIRRSRSRVSLPKSRRVALSMNSS